jgi:hypothetical protein
MKSLFTFLLCFVLSLPGQGQTDILPRPSGKHSVGVCYLYFTDDSRKELFDNSHKSNREITVKAWYPADEESNSEPYFLNADFAVDNCQFPEIFRSLKTNAGRDLLVSIQKKEYPVLVFSHGWSEHYSQNSILMEELASYGYIIFSIAHHYECRFSSYGDGRITHIDVNSLRFQKIMREQQSPKALELLHNMYNAANDDERRQVFLETSNILPTLLKESLQYWAEDISFFLDQLKDLNRKHDIFKTKLNLDRIGVFGMSMGGIASSETCLKDKRIKAGINIDGGLYASALDGKIKIPFMFLNSKRFLGYGQLFTSHSTTDCYSLSVKNSDHYNFTDYSIYSYPLAERFIGSIDGKKIIEIMNVMVLAFFDKYLKEIKDIDLIKEASKYSEIEIVTNIYQN